MIILLLISSETLPIVNELEVFEFNLILSDLHFPVSLTLYCFNSSKRVSNFNSADNYGNQMPSSRYAWEELKEQIW